MRTFTVATMLLAAGCSKPIEVAADAAHEAEKWAAKEGWVPDSVHCFPAKGDGEWGCALRDANWKQVVVVCTARGCSKD